MLGCMSNTNTSAATKPARVTTSVVVDVPVQSQDDSDWGYADVDGNHWFRHALVGADGTVKGWDEIAGYYRGDLPEALTAKARELASFSDADRAAADADSVKRDVYLSAFARLGGVSSDPQVNRQRQRRARKEAREIVAQLARLTSDGECVADPDGGRWWPGDEAAAEIAASADPAATAARICAETPMRGTWHD